MFSSTLFSRHKPVCSLDVRTTVTIWQKVILQKLTLDIKAESNAMSCILLTKCQESITTGRFVRVDTKISRFTVGENPLPATGMNAQRYTSCEMETKQITSEIQLL
jgi:hypothetical protein